VTTRVAVDALGGDHAPDEVVAGVAEAVTDGIAPILFGPASLETHGLDLVECTETIGMHEKPADAVRGKPNSSLVRAVKAVGDGEASAVVSAGNTGAMLAASLLHIRRLPGVMRPGIAIVIPSRRGPTVLIDAGANADARPEHLVQFAHMGAVFAEEILDVRDPSVRLLSIGEEPEKGNQMTLEAHDLLEAADLRFEGNTEGRTLLEGDADVVVCDGFTGNVALKTLEGTIRSILEALRGEIRSSARGRIGGLLIRPAARGLRARLDPETTGGGYLLGLRGLVVIAHGSSSRIAIANATRMAARGVEHRLVERLADRLPTERPETRTELAER
jgi:glycerol-3-phosphate acyltransferase PlsX